MARRYADTRVPEAWYRKESSRTEIHVPATEGWAYRHITRGGAFRQDLARCAPRHGAYEEDLAAIGVGFRPAAPAR
ncbi:hypothetical protein SCYAM73S_02425 [Streptomyces cyaneofuscatus]|nr:hypothetical protein STIB_16010 [Streptomyces sp. IB2014 011-1]